MKSKDSLCLICGGVGAKMTTVDVTHTNFILRKQFNHYVITQSLRVTKANIYKFELRCS